MTPLHQALPATRTVRAAIATDTAHGAVVPPIHLSTNFAFAGFNSPRKFDYTRSGNPTRSQLADALTDLEGGAGAVVTSTGMSAVLLPLQLLNAGDVIIAAHDCYGGTQRLLRGLARRGQIDVAFANLTDASGLATIAARRPKLVLVETPSNPLLRITDVRRVAAASHAVGARMIVDNTFLSPALQQPIALGADIVVHSTTKYLNGHSDVVGGAVVAADAALADELAWWANCLGVTGAPFDSYLTLRGVRTLFARIAVHQANAEAVVDALSRHAAVERVYYPGLATHPGHDIARGQQSGFGAMVSFDVRGGTRAIEVLASRLRHFTLAESLGGVESLVAHPATMTHASMDAGARAAAGISDSLVRLSVGIESASDLVRDLEGALDGITQSGVTQSGVTQSGVTRSGVTRSGVTRSGGTRSGALDVVLIGAGVIGRELVSQIAARSDDAEHAVRICGVADQSGYVFVPDGISREHLAGLCVQKAGGVALAGTPGGVTGTASELVERLVSRERANPVVADVTASDTRSLLRVALSRGYDAVLANKIPLAADQASFDELQCDARRIGRRVLHEATVGAGLPVIDTLHKLIESGDEIAAIEGCPSGTLGFLFGALSEGRAFSAALSDATAAGYTEPDPRTDLSGIDVARKALILARLIGFRGELSDVIVDSLVPADLGALSRDEFVTRAPDLDDAWAQRVRDARAAGGVLRYRARVTPLSITVGLVTVPERSPLASLSGTDNQFAFTTARYSAHPLVITGPGAGPSVTAAGVFSDLLKLAAEGSSGRMVRTT